MARNLVFVALLGALLGGCNLPVPEASQVPIGFGTDRRPFGTIEGTNRVFTEGDRIRSNYNSGP